SDALRSSPCSGTLTAMEGPATDEPRTRDFARFYREYFGAIGRSLRRLSGDEAEDVVQQAFTLAFERWDTVMVLEAPDAWVWVVATHEGSVKGYAPASGTAR